MDEHLKKLLTEVLQEAAQSGLLVGAGTSVASPYSTPWRDAKGVAEYVGMSVNWVRGYMMGISHRPGGSDPRWHIEEVDAWIRSSSQSQPIEQEEPGTGTAIQRPARRSR